MTEDLQNIAELLRINKDHNQAQKAAWAEADDTQKVTLVNSGEITLIHLLMEGIDSGTPAVKNACKKALKKRLTNRDYAKTLKEFVHKVDGMQDMSSQFINILNQLPPETQLTDLQQDFRDVVDAFVLQIEGLQRTLVAYAKTAIPELNDLPSNTTRTELISRLQNLRPEWKLTDQTPAIEIHGLLVKELQRQLGERRRKLAPIATNGYFPAPADRINKAFIESLAPGALKPKNQITPELEALEARGAGSHTFWAAYTFDSSSKSKGELHGAIGYTKDPGEALWAMMETNNATAIKMQFILWARAYSETDAEPGQTIRLSVNQLCDDLGYKRKNYAHKRENKQRAGKVFEMLMQREISVIVTDPKGKTVRLRGPLWNRGISADEYEDLFGANRAGDPASWIPSVLSYSPGDWFNDPAWRAYNRHIAYIGEGMLKLSGEKKDKYAVTICAYLGMLARMNSYRPSSIKAKTLLEKSGLWAADGKNNPGRMIQKLEDALNRLKDPEIEFIKDWYYKGKDDPNIDYDNLDDTDTLAALADDGADPDERNRVIIIEWPDKLEERRIELEAKQQKHLREGKKRRSAKPKRGEYPPPKAGNPPPQKQMKKNRPSVTL